MGSQGITRLCPSLFTHHQACCALNVVEPSNPTVGAELPSYMSPFGAGDDGVVQPGCQLPRAGRWLPVDLARRRVKCCEESAVRDGVGAVGRDDHVAEVVAVADVDEDVPGVGRGTPQDASETAPGTGLGLPPDPASGWVQGVLHAVFCPIPSRSAGLPSITVE